MRDIREEENHYVVSQKGRFYIYCQGRQSTDQTFDTLEAAMAHIRELEVGITLAEFVRAGVGS